MPAQDTKNKLRAIRPKIAPALSLSGRKPRYQSSIEKLPKAQRNQLIHWLAVENRTYDAVVKLCAEKFNFKIATSGLSNFYRKYFSAVGIAQHRPKPPAFEITLTFTPPDTITLRVTPGAGIKFKGARA